MDVRSTWTRWTAAGVAIVMIGVAGAQTMLADSHTARSGAVTVVSASPSSTSGEAAAPMMIAISAQAVPYGDLPASRFPPQGWEDLQAFTTTGWAVLDVTSASAVGSANVIAPNSTAVDAAAKLEDIIRATSGNRILYFPAGNYYLRTKLDIAQSNIVLRGAGKGITKLNIVAPADVNAEIEFRGVGPGTEVDVTNFPKRGDQTVNVASAAAFNVGGFAHVYDLGKVPAVRYDGLATVSHYGQIVRVTGKSGSTLTLDMKLGLNMDSNPKITPVTLIQQVGVENLSVLRDRAASVASTNNIDFVFAYNVFANNVESAYLEQGGIVATLSKLVVVVNSDIHDAFDYGVGGQAYGIKMGLNTTQCRITNNKMWTLRHHILLDRGANHCVVSFNSAEAGFEGTTGDLSIHGFSNHNNLFEGNMGRDLKWDGRSDYNQNQFQGLFNTAYRNRLTAYATNFLSVLDPNEPGNKSHHMPTIIGNLMNAILVEGNVFDPFVGANRINGSIVQGTMTAGATYPASLYETDKPSFFGTKAWPIFGPGVTDYGNGSTIPAFDRPKVNSPKPN